MLRSKRLKPRRATPRRREGRLHGKALAELREAVYARSGGYCGMHGILIARLNEALRDGKMTMAHWEKCRNALIVRCRTRITESTMHLAHLRSKGAGGADSLENTVAACEFCHLAGDHNFFGSPCPPKEQP